MSSTTSPTRVEAEHVLQAEKTISVPVNWKATNQGWRLEVKVYAPDYAQGLRLVGFIGKVNYGFVLLYHNYPIRMKDRFTIRPLAKGCVIVTPFRHFDMSFIELYAESTPTGYVVSDGGETLNMLFISGLTIEERPDLMKQAQRIATKHGVHFKESAFSVHATDENIGSVTDSLIHAIQAIGFFIYRRSHRNRPTFRDEVEEVLMNSRIVYVPDHTIRGYGKMHTIDFYVHSGNNILIDVLSATTISSARRKIDAVAFKHLDLQKANVPHHFLLAIDERKQETARLWNDEIVQEEIDAYFPGSTIWWYKEQLRFIDILNDSVIEERYAQEMLAVQDTVGAGQPGRA